MASNRVKSQGAQPSTDSAPTPQHSSAQLEPEEVVPDPSLIDKGADPLASAGEKMPDVQQHAVDAEKRRTDEAAAETAEASKLVDAKGTPFDPAVHEALGGVPQKTTAGVWKKRRGGAPKNTEARRVNTGKPAASGSAPSGEPVKPAPTEAEIMTAAATSAELLFAGGQIIGGDEWAPMKLKVGDGIEVDERTTMVTAFAGYYRAKGIADVPPGILLAAVIIGYGAKRFAMPKTQSRWQKVKVWAYETWGKFRGRRAAMASSGDKKPRDAERVDAVPDTAKEAERA